ncbi:unnamed protein product [Arctogadus glacialis]
MTSAIVGVVAQTNAHSYPNEGLHGWGREYNSPVSLPNAQLTHHQLTREEEHNMLTTADNTGGANAPL